MNEGLPSLGVGPDAGRVIAAAEDAALQVKRGQRKERKALSAAEAKAKRDAKYAARKARK